MVDSVPTRYWWLVAAVAALADRVFTFSYFIPTMLKLMGDETLSEPKSMALALQWVNLNYVRHALPLIAWVTALKAFSVFGKHGG